jgi:hypothetical protein
MASPLRCRRQLGAALVTSAACKRGASHTFLKVWTSSRLLSGGRLDYGAPPRQGLYDPAHEKDSCGVGFVVDIKGVRTHTVVEQALE